MSRLSDENHNRMNTSGVQTKTLQRRNTGMSMQSEEVGNLILQRVMKRLEGKGDEQGYRNPTEQEESLRQEAEYIKNAGKELIGIGRSIQALIHHFNVTLEKHSRGEKPAIKQNHDEYKSCFAADIPKLSKLIDNEIEYRSELLGQ